MGRADRRDTERGQVVVLFAGAIVALLAVTALVVDIGFVFQLRRQEQNGADPAAVAAARFIPSGSTADMWTAACFYALDNDFRPTRTDSGARCDGARPSDGSTITVNYPPARSAGEYAGNRGYVEVVIDKPHQSFFAGVVGLGRIPVTTSAVAAFDTGAAGTSSLVSLNPSDCAAAKINGGGRGGGISIFPATGVPAGTGGFIQVNSSCGAASGGNDNCADGASGGLTIDGGATLRASTAFVVGGCVVNGASGDLGTTRFDERAAFIGDPLALVRPPSPADLPAQPCPGAAVSGTATAPRTCNLPAGAVTLTPGTYYGGWAIQRNTSLTLQPGIYILAGGGISQTGGITAASGRVLIYGTDSPRCGTGSAATNCQQKFDFTGSTSLNLRGLSATTACPPYGNPGCPYGGLLFWQDASASGAGTDKANVELEGTGSLYLEGTVYTSSGDVIITGNGLSTGCTPDGSGNTNCAAVQVIADSWQVGGAGVLAMPYDPEKFYKLRLKGLVR